MFQYMLVADAAKVLQSSRSSIYDLMKQNRLEGTQIEGKYFVTQESVERYSQLKKRFKEIQNSMQEKYYTK